MTNATFVFSFNFSTREQYMEQRAAWKANYAALTRAQREAKATLRQAARANKVMGPFIDHVEYNQRTATTLLTVLADAKEEAQRQYTTAREQRMAA